MHAFNSLTQKFPSKADPIYIIYISSIMFLLASLPFCSDLPSITDFYSGPFILAVGACSMMFSKMLSCDPADALILRPSWKNTFLCAAIPFVLLTLALQFSWLNDNPPEPIMIQSTFQVSDISPARHVYVTLVNTQTEQTYTGVYVSKHLKNHRHLDLSKGYKLTLEVTPGSNHAHAPQLYKLLQQQ